MYIINTGGWTVVNTEQCGAIGIYEVVNEDYWEITADYDRYGADIGQYDTEDDAKKDFQRIVDALKNGVRVLDLRTTS